MWVVVFVGSGPKPVELEEVSDNMYQATYYPVKEGPCTFDVKYDNESVPGRYVLLLFTCMCGF